MNITLPPNLEDYLANLIRAGSYKGADEIIQEALREHQFSREKLDVVMTPELERLLDEGLEDAGHSKTTDELRRHS